MTHGEGGVQEAVTVADSRRSPPKISTLRKVVPFVILAILLTLIYLRIDRRAFLDALAKLDVPTFLAFAFVWQVVLLGADALGNYAAYRLTMPNVRWGDFYVFRGASYLPGILNHHLGQAYLTYLMSKLAKIPVARAGGATLISYAGWAGCLLGCVAVALPLAGEPLGYVPIILGAGVLYLAVIVLKPKRLQRFALLGPLFEAGLKGHAIALAARLPHMMVMVFGTWAAYFFFDVEIPVGRAMLNLPIILVATTLPITPGGGGTREEISNRFFWSFAPGSGKEEQMGHLTAATLAWSASITLSGVILALFCTRVVKRRLAAVGA